MSAVTFVQTGNRFPLSAGIVSWTRKGIRLSVEAVDRTRNRFQLSAEIWIRARKWIRSSVETLVLDAQAVPLVRRYLVLDAQGDPVVC